MNGGRDGPKPGAKARATFRGPYWSARNRLAQTGTICQNCPMLRFLTALPLLFALFAPALNAQANPTMSAEEFDAYTRGKTFFYESGGEAYGAEEYLDNRRVIWTFLDGRCQYGEWFERGPSICFIYENQPEEQCWSFTQTSAGLIAQFENDPDALELYEVEQTSESLACMGPDVGA